MSGSDSNTWVIICCFPGKSTADCIGSRMAMTWTGISTWDAIITSRNLTHCTTRSMAQLGFGTKFYDTTCPFHVCLVCFHFYAKSRVGEKEKKKCTELQVLAQFPKCPQLLEISPANQGLGTQCRFSTWFGRDPTNCAWLLPPRMCLLNWSQISIPIMQQSQCSAHFMYTKVLMKKCQWLLKRCFFKHRNSLAWWICVCSKPANGLRLGLQELENRTN